MTGLLVLPTKTAGSIGQVKNTLPEDVGVEVDLDYYETAAEAERQKDALIAMAARMGLGDGTTPGSFEAMKAGFEAGEGLRLMTLDGSGAYASIRIEDSFAAPTSAHGYSAGYRVGSWWVERGLGEGPGVPGPITLWECLSDTDDAAAWQVRAIPASTAATDIARAGAAGSSIRVARADHVHDGGVQPVRTVTASATLTTTDAIVLVSTAAGDVSLTLPAPDKVGRNFRIKKITADTNLISLVPHDTSGSGPMIEDGGSGETVDLPDSNIAARNAWFLVWSGTQWWL